MWTTRLRRSTEEFWSLTYREVFACIDDYFEQHQSEQRGWDIRAGLICATIRNSNPFSTSKKFWTWTDFFEDNQQAVTAPAGETKLNMTTKIRFRQLASYWQAKREKEGG